MRKARLAVIGAGRAGSALAALLHRRGWTVAAVASAHLADARRLARRCGAPLATTDPARAAGAAEAVLIAVPDRAIPRIAALLADSAPAREKTERGRGQPARGEGAARRSGRAALHLSGASGGGLLEPLRRAGWSVGSFHPLVAFPPANRPAPSLRGVTIAIDGDPRALKIAGALAASLGATTLSLPARDRARYHLAACFASTTW